MRTSLEYSRTCLYQTVLSTQINYCPTYNLSLNLGPNLTPYTFATHKMAPLFILYGSATGNAEHIAKDLAQKFSPTAAFDSVICAELDQYKKKCLPTWETAPPDDAPFSKYGVIVVSSTTGNGDAPENAGRFARYIKRKSTVDIMPFRHCAFAVLGLGDTNYDKFCAVGKLADKKMLELGGTRAKALGLADEATGLEDVVEPWVESVFDEIVKACIAISPSSPKSSLEANDGKEAALSTDNTKKEMMKESLKISENKSVEEEKKSEIDARAELVQAVHVTSTSSEEENGVSAIRALLSLPDSSPIPSVPHNTLPLIGPSLSSCQLIHHTEEESADRGINLSEFDRMTVSTSSSAAHFNLNHPYKSSILGARYLTNTDTAGAKESAAILANTHGSDSAKMIRAMACFEKHFPLNSAEDDELNGKRVIEMRLEIPDDYTLEYQPGDSIGLTIPNDAAATDFVLKMLMQNSSIDPEQKVSVDAKRPITVADAVRSQIDLCSPIKNKRVLMFFSSVASDSEEEAALRLLSSKFAAGEDIFNKFVDEQRISAVDILRLFPSCQNVSLTGLLGTLPSIAPRYYSVTSSPLTKEGDSSLTVAFSVVDYLTPSTAGLVFGRRRIGGVATRYLECICSPFLSQSSSSGTSHKVSIFPKPTSDFQLPANLSTPLILIGPGTGVAPFMGFLAHRQSQIASNETTRAAKASVEGTWRGGYDLEEDEMPVSNRDGRGLNPALDFTSNQVIGDIDLFFGCRHKHHDWLYEEEMMRFKEDGIIKNLQVAFSRDGKDRLYVQNKITGDAAERIRTMVLDKKCAIYVCGDGNAMAKDVQDAIIEVLAQAEKIADDSSNFDDAKIKATAILEQMKASNKFVLDIWS